MGRLWLYVTHDDYEFPIYIAESIKELAELMGVTPDALNQAYYRYKNGAKSWIRRVDLDETYDS